jgi:hypothetical protein
MSGDILNENTKIKDFNVQEMFEAGLGGKQQDKWSNE